MQQMRFSIDASDSAGIRRPRQINGASASLKLLIFRILSVY